MRKLLFSLGRRPWVSIIFAIFLVGCCVACLHYYKYTVLYKYYSTFIRKRDANILAFVPSNLKPFYSRNYQLIDGKLNQLDLVIVIHRHDRHDRFILMLDILTHVIDHVPWTFFNATTPDSQDLKNVMASYSNNKHPPASNVACFLSHWKLWSIIASYKEQRFIAILEDDVDVDVYFMSKAAMVLQHAPKDWDILYLSSCFAKLFHKNLVASNGRIAMYKHQTGGCTAGYVIHSKSARKLRDLFNISSTPPALAIDYLLNYLIEQNKIIASDVRPWLVAQIRNVPELGPGDVSADTNLYERVEDSSYNRVRKLKVGFETNW